GVGGRDTWDEAPTCGLTGESRVKWADQHRRHGSLDGTRPGATTEHALGTKAVAPTVRVNPDRCGRNSIIALHSNVHGRPLPRLHPRTLSTAPQLRGHRGC